ncbi:MAG: hypothetical protein A3B65_02515 [Acidobacteria bacterium RIFCSPHIGHO2_02_FULL_67_57]|nr:MAG: hypothetical protein A3B65_02515 [Acidobacteria bacterium RIFCSPHIGHO2_02_FULL_67_57]
MLVQGLVFFAVLGEGDVIKRKAGNWSVLAVFFSGFLKFSISHLGCDWFSVPHSCSRDVLLLRDNGQGGK